jgi:hypothetical protein
MGHHQHADDRDDSQRSTGEGDYDSRQDEQAPHRSGHALHRSGHLAVHRAIHDDPALNEAASALIRE